MMLAVKCLFLSLLFSYCYSEIEVDTNAFKIWRQVQKVTQRNHIKLRFKTVHATGLIMFAIGANKKDFLSVELYRGKIRIAANYGNSTANMLRPIGGFYDMYLGKDLADNEWHTVEFIRNIRESTIFIDRGQGKMEKSSFSKSPPTYNELSISTVTFGGYYSFATSELSTQQALSRKGLKACFSEATFSQVWPEDNSQEVDFIRSNIPTIGTILDTCPKPKIPYAPLFFPSSAVHIALLENYTVDALKVSMKFRTVVSDQMLANYTTIETGNAIKFRIDRKGHISLSIDLNFDTQIIETAKAGYHDGEWHDVSFEIDNKEAEGKSYLGKFTVDGKTRLSTISQRFKFNGYVNVGFGFTGCMRDVKINDADINKVVKDKRFADEFFTISDVGVIYNSCSLKDYCNPNPCKNGATCNQTDDNIVCNCRNTLYEGSTCHRARFNYTCAGVRKSGELRSDVYFIDFDGMGPMEPVRALCDLRKSFQRTTTQINNTKYMEIDVSTPSKISNVDINYAASIIQMRELIMNSAHCKQYIKFTCHGAPLFRSPEGPPAARWMGGDDILHYYWGGARNNRGYCACGIAGKCRNRKKYCNCDDLNPYKNVYDEGNFTVKEHLPVRQAQFTEVLQGSVKSDLLVGHLRCSGFGSHGIAATFRKPYSFLSVYHPDQPFDNIYAGGISFDFKTSLAYNYMVMVHAQGPFSGDYIKIMIWSKTMMRVHLNLGFGDIKQDVDISGTGRMIDDNQWHEFDVMFNLKELNVTLDGVRMIQGLPLQDDPVQFNVDAKPVYIGGSYHDPYGFVGCIRSLYVNGRIHDIRTIAAGQEDFGVYPGCGSACMLLNQPCNYGFCIDEYDAFKCNCSVSPFGGKYCQNETYPKKFTGSQFIEYDLEKANISEPLAGAIFVVGFKTTLESVALAQLEGKDGRHFSMGLSNGYLSLFYTQKKKKIREGAGVIEDTETEIMRITKRKLNNNQHNIARVYITTDEIYLSVPNYGLTLGRNATERYIDEDNKNLGKFQDYFDVPIIISVGRIKNKNIDPKGWQLPSSFTGCMSGAKFVYQPRATLKKRFRTSFEIDLFQLIKEKPKNNPTGSFPSVVEICAPDLPIPGELPTVGPARQFFTRSPGLDNSVTVKTVDMVNQVILMLVIIIIAVVLLGFLYMIYRYVNRNNMKYNRLKKDQKPREAIPSSSYKPMSNVPPTTFQEPSKYSPAPTHNAPVAAAQKGAAGKGGDEENRFL